MTTNIIKSSLKKYSEVITNEIQINNTQILIIYVEKLANLGTFYSFHFKKIKDTPYDILSTEYPGLFLPFEDVNSQNILNKVFDGNIIIVSDNKSYCVPLEDKPKRGISTSNLDPTNLFASQESFIEDIKVNIALVRKTIKDPNLLFKEIKIGQNNENSIYILGINKETEILSIAKLYENNKNEIATTINSIAKPIQKNHLYPITSFTSSVDNFCNALLNDRIGIMLSNSPTQMIVPANLTFFSTIKNETDAPNYFLLGVKGLIIFFLLTSIFLLGFFTAMINYNLNSFTLNVLSSIKVSERGTTLPMFLEVLLVLIIFEFYRFTTSRSSPGYVQNIIIIVGGLLIGQNLVFSGLIGTMVLFSTALSYLATYAYTNNLYLISAISTSRIIIVIASYLFGLYGFFASSFIILIYLISLNSLDLPYLYPLFPFDFKQFKNFILPKSKGKKNE